jgi:hypothetical protein
MHLREVRLRGFRRFHDLQIIDLPGHARLVVMAGPNGRGKTCVFDGFQAWQARLGGRSFIFDISYHLKDGQGSPQIWPNAVDLKFHEDIPSSDEQRWRIIYVRSAYRNQADFAASGLEPEQPFQSQRLPRLIDDEARVAGNYARLVARTVQDVYSRDADQETISALRDRYIARVRAAMNRLFPDLTLVGPGNPLLEGTFFFDKGSSKDFRYKNLSGGEKAAFDLLLDMTVARMEYKNSIYCIDEPELHLSTRLQAQLLDELLDLLPDGGQLWIATHSLGMFSKVKDLSLRDPSSVAVLDFEKAVGDQPITLSPVSVDRAFWRRSLHVALDDLANLVAPREMVLCEGSAKDDGFDAACYGAIFGSEFPETDFMSVGNAADVVKQDGPASAAVQTISPGTSVVRLIDRDDRSEGEVAALRGRGIRVLSRRSLESFLFDNEILAALCQARGHSDKVPEVMAAKERALVDSQQRGNPADDMKSASGEIYTTVKKLLGLTQCGNTTRAFMLHALAPLVIPQSNIYAELRRDVFGK